MRRPGRLLLTGLLWAGCGGAGLEIPEPDMTGVEAEVRRAVEEDQRVVREAPRSAAGWGRLGDRYRAQRWLPQAASCYGRAEALDPADFRWPYLQGKSLRFDDPEAAAAAFERALALDPNYPPAHLFRGKALAHLGRFDEARESFETAYRLDPARAEGLVELGQLQLSVGLPEEARDYLERALALDPDNGGAHLALSRALLELGQSEAAARHAELARRGLRRGSLEDPRAELSVVPAGSWGLAKHGKDLLARGMVEQAEGALREAVRINPDLEGPRVTLGLVLTLRGRLDEAEQHLRHALWLKPDHAEAHAALGNLLLLSSQPRIDEAVEHLGEATRLDPGDARTRYHLALALLRSGAPGAAEEQLRRVLEADPGSAEARSRLAFLLGRRGEERQAERELREVLRLVESETEGLADARRRFAAGERRPEVLRALQRLERGRRLAAEAHADLARLLQARGASAEAERHRAQARRLRSADPPDPG